MTTEKVYEDNHYREKMLMSMFYFSDLVQRLFIPMNGKLVKTSVDCVGVSKKTVVIIKINLSTVWLRIRY